MALIYDGDAALVKPEWRDDRLMGILNAKRRRQPRGYRLGCRGLVFEMAAFLCVVSTLLSLSGCDAERRKSDAELGLNPQQAAGRTIYDQYCDRCHEPYSTRGKKGPGLKGLFQHQYLPLSGLPANDERVLDIVNHGRNEMPGYNQTLNAQDVQDLLAYMHTL